MQRYEVNIIPFISLWFNSTSKCFSVLSQTVQDTLFNALYSTYLVHIRDASRHVFFQRFFSLLLMVGWVNHLLSYQPKLLKDQMSNKPNHVMYCTHMEDVDPLSDPCRISKKGKWCSLLAFASKNLMIDRFLFIVTIHRELQRSEEIDKIEFDITVNILCVCRWSNSVYKWLHWLTEFKAEWLGSDTAQENVF